MNWFKAGLLTCDSTFRLPAQEQWLHEKRSLKSRLQLRGQLRSCTVFPLSFDTTRSTLKRQRLRVTPQGVNR
jgi:hypothetical protein